jgi:hypothetical protein
MKASTAIYQYAIKPLLIGGVFYAGVLGYNHFFQGNINPLYGFWVGFGLIIVFG